METVEASSTTTSGDNYQSVLSIPRVLPVADSTSLQYRPSDFDDNHSLPSFSRPTSQYVNEERPSDLWSRKTNCDSRRGSRKRVWTSLVSVTYESGECAAFVVYFEARNKKAIDRSEFVETNHCLQCIMLPALQTPMTNFTADKESLSQIDRIFPALLSAINSWIFAYNFGGLLKEKASSESSSSPQIGWVYSTSQKRDSFLLADINNSSLYQLRPVVHEFGQRSAGLSRMFGSLHRGLNDSHLNHVGSLPKLDTSSRLPSVDSDQIRLCEKWINALDMLNDNLRVM